MAADCFSVRCCIDEITTKLLLAHLDGAALATNQILTRLRVSCLEAASRKALPVSTPMHRPRRCLHAGLTACAAPAQAAVASCPPKCTLGTFGWWEVVSPTEAAIRTLCATLAAQHVHCCIVTGLPSAACGSFLDGRFGFVWVGEMHPDVFGVGLLLAVPWRGSFVVIPAFGAVSRRIIFFKMPGPTLGV